ncbi:MULTISPECIES: hypothetical protein [Streptomyces]|uniref:Uncharacterized protein n=1 Tax=Streptomyces olivaceiscleroticus TaxID=68245 RepID=A0ABN1ATV6_9ACTN|nr:hypothetical protein [Streptomyces niger]
MDLYCHTCHSYEEHREPTKKEKAALRPRVNKKNVDDHVICTNPGCGHVRTTWTPCATENGHIRAS